MFVTRHFRLLAGAMAFGSLVAVGGPGSTAEVDRTTGQYLYVRFCIACHGPDGKGTVIGLPLVGRPTGPITKDHLIKVVRKSLDMMPDFPADLLSDEHLERIADHVALLESRAAGTSPPPAALPASQAKKPNLAPVPQVAPADPASYVMKEYPSPCGAGHSISVGPDGKVWIAGIAQHKLIMFDPQTEQFKCWNITTERGRPHGIKVDKDGFVWFTVTGIPQNKVTMFDPKTELFTDYYMPHTPQKFMYPHTLVFDAQQNPVFSFEYGDAIGRINRTTGRLDVWPVPTHRSRPYGIEVAKDGTIWAVEFARSNIVHLDAKTGKIEEIPHPGKGDVTVDVGIRRMALDSKGRVWLGEHEWGSVGLYDPAAKAFKSWRAPDNGGDAKDIYSFNLDKNDVLWFSHFGGNYIGRFDPKTEKFSVYPHISKPMNCRLMDLGQDGSVWCMGSAQPKLMHLTVKTTM